MLHICVMSFDRTVQNFSFIDRPHFANISIPVPLRNIRTLNTVSIVNPQFFTSSDIFCGNYSSNKTKSWVMDKSKFCTIIDETMIDFVSQCGSVLPNGPKFFRYIQLRFSFFQIYQVFVKIPSVMKLKV